MIVVERAIQSSFSWVVVTFSWVVVTPHLGKKEIREVQKEVIGWVIQ
jgi:hypothetical protein